jgi:hypothetical protein
MSQDVTLDDLFSTKTRVARASRYTVANSRETAEGGRVGVGVDSKGNAYLVHEIGRATEAVALGAVATAVAGGAIPLSALVRAFKETGQADALKAALTAAK